ncbi:MAG: excinuclease ABC subunit C [Ignavibacteriales bacterium]|nr:excinuclease ABC subunit C [Ignavibacteriales bacterium]
MAEKYFKNPHNLNLSNKLANLPKNPGVYQFKNANNDILYIGKALNLRNRVRQYFHRCGNISSRIKAMIPKIADIELIITDSEIEALILEATLIKKHKPHYNIDLKDDKSYPYIVITKEPYPRIFVTRKIVNDGSKYFGPYTEVGYMRESLKMIKDIFKVRSCNYFLDDESILKKKYKLCLDYHINQCDGPCEGLVSEEKYNEMIDSVALLLKGKTGKLISDWEARMNSAAEGLHFEEAKRYRDGINQLRIYSERQKIIEPNLSDRDIIALVKDVDDACCVIFNVREGKITGKKHLLIKRVEGKPEEEIIEQMVQNYYLDATEIPSEIYLSHRPVSISVIQEWLKNKRDGRFKIIIPRAGEKIRLMNMCKLNAKIILDEYLSRRNLRNQKIPEALLVLKKHLQLKTIPHRIECFDISNIQGTDSVASMVVFIDGKPRKSEYRKFKINSVLGADDYASMKEVIGRRYKRLLEEKSQPPDLIMVDGGKGQLSSATEVLKLLQLWKEEKKGVSIIGLAKKLEEVYLPETPEPQNIPKASPALHLLQRIRNEAHRFAISYHRQLRGKRTIKTEIEEIGGIGKQYSNKLLKYFGSLKGIQIASYEKLKEIVGAKNAVKIIQYFSEK